jgi:hypothetical protein
MLHEHAITYTGRLTIADLEYISKKANRLGRLGKELVRAHEETDSEGTHLYFDVIGGISEQRRTDEEIS